MAAASPDQVEPEQHQSQAFMTQAELAARWGISTRTLGRWRSSGIGPRWILLGGRIRYARSDIAEFEARQGRGSTG